MRDLISRQAAIEAAEKIIDGSAGYKSWAIVAKLRELPSAEPDERTGEWKVYEDFYGDINYECSECKSVFILIDGTPEDNDYRYCPHCGARMGWK